MTPEFNIRPWKIEDISDLVVNANNPKIAQFMTDGFPHPYAWDNGMAFIEMANKENPVHIFCIDVNGEACGGIGLHLQHDIQRKNAELGYWLAEKYWGKGIVTQAIDWIVDYGFATYDIDRIFARPFGHNIASQRVLDKSGFKLEGRFEKTLYKNGEFVDELVYAIRRKK